MKAKRSKLHAPTAVLLCLALVISLVPLSALDDAALAAPVPGTDVTYTIDADFDKGTLQSVNHDAPNNNQLQLNKVAQPFPFVNIAASARGTAIRIDVNTGQILGEYLTAPDGMGRNPSRTTVDKFGNVWVANRAEFGSSAGQPKGSVARIGLIIGGTRVNADGTPNPGGEYLKPPFQYNTCIDRNSDGLIRTSKGLGNILAWTNAGGANTHGGVSTADDECIINYTRVTGTATRTVAIDANNDVWVGGLGDRDHEKLDGITGQPVPGTQWNIGRGGYGGLIDKSGVLWSARELVRYDPSNPFNPNPPVSFPAPTDAANNPRTFENTRGDYGLGIDPRTGHIWHSSLFYSGVHGPCCRLYELDSVGNVVNSYQQPFGAQGVAVDGNRHVWMAEIFGSRVWHLAPDPANPNQHVSVGIVSGFQGVTGVAVDANGKIWAAEINGNRASRIDPNAGPVGAGGYKVGAIDLSVSLGSGAGPYNYSDMTGFVAIGSTSPQGTWTVVQDSGAAGTKWGRITWNKEPQGSVPADTSITVEARAADTEAGLASQPFVAVSNDVLFALVGRFIEVRVTLKASAAGVSPVLSDMRIKRANEPPTVDAGGPYAGKEGTSVALTGSASDPDGDSLTVNWTYAPGAGVDAGATCTFPNPNALNTEITCTDDGTYMLTLTASDGVNPAVSDTATLTLANVAPVLTITAPTAGQLFAAPASVSLSASFSDAGKNDTHSCSINWDDPASLASEAGTVSEANGTGTCTKSHTFNTAGVYTIQVAVTDDDDAPNADTESVMIVVYDPSAGFVTGGGWIDSPAGAYTADATLSGKATFGFVSKYQRGATAPTGQTEFQFHVANLNFHSGTYYWLVVSGAKAQYKGTGTVNGVAGYEFLLTVTDGQVSGGGGVDKFRIRIWIAGGVVYDSVLGGALDLDSANPQAIAGGSIVIHGGK